MMPARWFATALAGALAALVWRWSGDPDDDACPCGCNYLGGQLQ